MQRLMRINDDLRNWDLKCCGGNGKIGIALREATMPTTPPPRKTTTAMMTTCVSVDRELNEAHLHIGIRCINHSDNTAMIQINDRFTCNICRHKPCPWQLLISTSASSSPSAALMKRLTRFVLCSLARSIYTIPLLMFTITVI